MLLKLKSLCIASKPVKSMKCNINSPGKYPINTIQTSKTESWLPVAPVCKPTLPVIGLQMPCMEKAGVALQLFLSLKY